MTTEIWNCRQWSFFWHKSSTSKRRWNLGNPGHKMTLQQFEPKLEEGRVASDPGQWQTFSHKTIMVQCRGKEERRKPMPGFVPSLCIITKPVRGFVNSSGNRKSSTFLVWINTEPAHRTFSSASFRFMYHWKKHPTMKLYFWHNVINPTSQESKGSFFKWRR